MPLGRFDALLRSLLIDILTAFRIAVFSTKPLKGGEMRAVAWALFASVLIFQTGDARADWQDDTKRANDCYADAARDPAIQILHHRLALGSEPTLDQLADEGFATDADISAARLRDERTRPCREVLLASAAKHHPFLRPAYQMRFFQTDLVLVQFMQRRITYGNANMLLKQSYLDFAEREARYFQAQSEAQRRAVAESMDSLAQSPRIPTGSGRMTCRWVGSTLYCDPY